MHLNAPGLENDVVRLETLTEAHREQIRASTASEAMWEWMPLISSGTSFDSYVDYCLDAGKTDTFYPFVAFRQSDGAFAGLAAYERVARTHRRLGIGFIWHPEEMRGTVIAPATQLALLERAWNARFRRVSYMIRDTNERAICAIERVGARQEGLLRNYFRAAHGGWANMALLSLVGDEIKAAISLLRDRVKQMQLA